MYLIRYLVCSLFFMMNVAQAQMPRIEVSAGIHRISAEVAANDPARQQGLMHRRSMAQHEGMIFAFPESTPVCMWMRNTLIPLSVAFINENGQIINIEDMQPMTENSHCAKQPARYALEMNKGWFAKRGLGRGSQLSGLERIAVSR